MKKIIRLTEATARAIHQELIAEYGGAPGLRDAGLLASALARVDNRLAYGEPSLFELAAACAHGLVRHHPFIDGNKRTGLMVAYVFLRLNGWRLVGAEVEAVAVLRDLAAGELDEQTLAAWIEANSENISP